MDVGTLQALVGLLTLLVLVFGALLGAVWRQVSLVSSSFSEHQVVVAREYVTKTDHDRRLDQEMQSIKDMLKAMEANLERLIAMSQKDRSVA